MKVEKLLADMDIQVTEENYEEVYQSLHYLINPPASNEVSVDSNRPRGISVIELWQMLATVSDTRMGTYLWRVSDL